MKFFSWPCVETQLHHVRAAAQSEATHYCAAWEHNHNKTTPFHQGSHCICVRAQGWKGVGERWLRWLGSKSRLTFSVVVVVGCEIPLQWKWWMFRHIMCLFLTVLLLWGIISLSNSSLSSEQQVNWSWGVRHVVTVREGHFPEVLPG